MDPNNFLDPKILLDIEAFEIAFNMIVFIDKPQLKPKAKAKLKAKAWAEVVYIITKCAIPT